MRSWGNIPQVGGPAPLQYEPSGTWVCKEDNFFVHSRDGKNWDRTALPGINNSAFQGDIIGGDYLVLGVNGSAQSFRADNKGIPDFDVDSGSPDGVGLCAWVASNGSNAVARTTTQLRTSPNGIDWTDQDSSAPANWSSIGSGPFRYSPTAGLYLACGSTFSIGFLDQYFTSANRTTWTQRTFPVNWTANGQGGNVDWFVDNGSIAIMCLQIGGAIYSSTDLINWTLRTTTGGVLTGACWNPILGAFYAITTNAGDDKIERSTDGITWNPVAGNDLGVIIGSGQLSCDPVTGLMFVNGTASSTAFQTTDSAVSEDGVDWFPRWARSGNYMQHVPGKYGPLLDETLTITPDPITSFDAQGTPTNSFARVIVQNDGTIDRQTASGGIQEIGKWMAGPADSLSLAGREYRLDQNTGPALNFGTSPLGVWRSGNLQSIWGYATTFGSLTGTFTLRSRDKITLIEDTNGGVPVSISAEST